ncbi:MAG: hypothetical protein ISQ95_05655, partial [Flavobacteriales bacterium]|nr:hypothetical protein [Flavobacteriales bacterium]
MKKLLLFCSLIIVIPSSGIYSKDFYSQKAHHTALDANNRKILETLFNDWREFENPPLLNGAPDYTANSFNNRMPEFRELRDRLNEIDKSTLDTQSKVDWTLIWAEMNGFEFNYRVLKPWERDPAYYKSVWMNRSDVPAHEGPTH